MTDIRVYRGTECGTDHYLIRAKCTFTWKENHFKKQYINKKMVQDEKLNIELLQNESIRMLYQQRMDRELDEDFGQTTEDIYNYIKDKIRKITN